MVVGIGKDINRRELDHMAGGDGKAFVAKDFDQLISNNFVTEICENMCDIVIACK